MSKNGKYQPSYWDAKKNATFVEANAAYQIMVISTVKLIFITLVGIVG